MTHYPLVRINEKVKDIIRLRLCELEKANDDLSKKVDELTERSNATAPQADGVAVDD